MKSILQSYNWQITSGKLPVAIYRLQLAKSAGTLQLSSLKLPKGEKLQVS
jgi:hypothetical protein